MTSRILVTGAAGRVGSVVVAGLLAAGRVVRATDLVPVDPGCEFARADLNDAESCARLCGGVDTIVHLAGHPNSRDWTMLERANTAPTRTLFEAAGAAGARRIVYASSVHVVGFEPADVRLHDAMAYRPSGPYGVSKIAGEMLLRLACDCYGLSGIALRICSFRPAPTLARELRTWLSPVDMQRLALAAVDAPMDGFRTVWGLSNNARADVDRGGWAAIGYLPTDDAENYRASLAAAGVDTGIVSEWPRLGGAFAEAPPRP